MSDSLEKKQQPEETPEFAYADKWLQRIITYIGLPSGILAVIFSQTYLAIACFLWLAVAIGYAFIKKHRTDTPQTLEIGTLGEFEPHSETPIEKQKQDDKQLSIAEQLSETKLPLERPNILTVLVIDAVNPHKIDFHIEIENKGKIDAKNIRVGYVTDEVTILEITPYFTRKLSHGGKLSISKSTGVLKHHTTTSLIVKIFYNVELNGVEKYFLQKVRFLIRPADIKTQTINPEACEENEVDSTNAQDLIPHLVQFSQSTGTIVIVLPEVGRNGNPNMIFYGNEFRSFSFDSIARIVSLKVKTSLGRLISLDLPLLASKSGNHLVMIMWDYSKGGLLRLDGIERQDMRENTE